MKERCNFIVLLATAIFFLFNAVAGFNIINPTTKVNNKSNLIMFLTKQEQEQATAMSEYLVRSHEAKLKAIQELEDNKNKEIDSLNQQINELQKKLQQQPPPPPKAAAATTAKPKKVSPPTTGNDLSSLSKEELISKVMSYQNFMANYVVDSHLQKVESIKAVEETVTKKYEEILAPSSAVTTKKAAPTPAKTVEKKTESSAEKKLYLERNENVAKASEAGKSRWGDKEVQRAKDVKDSSSTPKKPIVVEKKVVAEKVNGKKSPPDMKMPEKVNGKKSPPEMKMPPKVNGTKEPTEVKKANNIVNIGASIVNGHASATAEIPVPPEVAEADHGMRADGGVGGLSLAERVSKGLNAPAKTPIQQTKNEEVSEMELIFRKRNKHISEAAKAGKSRWGNLEVNKANECVSKHSSNNGIQKLNGTTAPKRVNLGAQILGKDE